MGETTSSEGSATLALRDISVPVKARASFRGYRAAFELDAHYQIASLVPSLASEYLSDVSLTPEPPLTIPWRAGVAVTNASTDTRGGQFFGSITVAPQSVVITRREASIVATRETYSGAPWNAWSEPLFYREPPVNPVMVMMRLGPSPSSVQFTWKGVATTL